MGSLASLLVDAGHELLGSDPSPRPPMSDALKKKGITVLRGWEPKNLDLGPPPDLVVIGNVCRKDNPEAQRADQLGLRRLSMPGAIRELLVPGRKPLVVAGTHGKTTTTAILGSLLLRCNMDPTILLGGVSLDLGGAARLGQGPHLVIEGDEYDSAFFEKVPKFFSYEPFSASVSSVQHDHLDIYPDEASYIRAFEGLAERMDPQGQIFVWAGDTAAVEISKKATCETTTFALESDACAEPPQVSAQATVSKEGTTLEVTWPKGERTILRSPLFGEHNARNALAAISMAHLVAGCSLEEITAALSTFRGVALRQQLIGAQRGISVYRDFAHHPEAVAETIAAFVPVAPPGQLKVAYEPRTATACRKLHQDQYAPALKKADFVVLAPVARKDIPEAERLDTASIAEQLRKDGVRAVAATTSDEVVSLLADDAKRGDVFLLLSNGHFDQVDQKLLARLG